MAILNEQRKKRVRLGFHYTMELNFASEDSKKVFLSRVESAKPRLTPRGSLPLDSCELLSSPRSSVCYHVHQRSVSKPGSPYRIYDNAGKLRCVLVLATPPHDSLIELTNPHTHAHMHCNATLMLNISPSTVLFVRNTGIHSHYALGQV